MYWIKLEYWPSQVGPCHSNLILNENYVVRIMATEMSMETPMTLTFDKMTPKTIGVPLIWYTIHIPSLK